ncbi:hypothetical protein GCM10025864_39690 [Luteimicrobium album]|uniref:Uncharacterized protein n=1 Tax=Luteimicrobium album TaxID=1054550 RepID=A0ABQ6I6Q9_9MICO|nr:hypothetical protein GCM10025864_39690 [Luteimicrobium album]
MVDDGSLSYHHQAPGVDPSVGISCSPEYRWDGATRTCWSGMSCGRGVTFPSTTHPVDVGVTSTRSPGAGVYVEDAHDRDGVVDPSSNATVTSWAPVSTAVTNPVRGCGGSRDSNRRRAAFGDVTRHLPCR